MTEVEVAIADWKTVYESVRLDEHPSLWVGHYRGHTVLGSIHATRPKHEADLIVTLASPFAISADVLATFVVLDRPGYVWAGRLSYETHEGQSGVRSKFWRIPYSLTDKGKVEFRPGVEMSPVAFRIVQAFQQLADHRLRHTETLSDFDSAFLTSMMVSKDYDKL